MSNVFDDIYNKKLNLDFRNLKSETNYKNIKSEDLTNVKELEDEELNILFSALYNSLKVDDIPKYSKDQINIIDEKILRNRVKAQSMREEISRLKDGLIESVKEEAYVLDISKSNVLKKAANNIFGGNKKTITYEDYVQLIEMKKQIMALEADSLLEV